MKKNDFINNQLLSMGYLPLPYNKDRNKVFYKEMDNGLIVCVGIESSSLYQDRRKTVSFIQHCHIHGRCIHLYYCHRIVTYE